MEKIYMKKALFASIWLLPLYAYAAPQSGYYRPLTQDITPPSATACKTDNPAVIHSFLLTDLSGGEFEYTNYMEAPDGQKLFAEQGTQCADNGNGRAFTCDVPGATYDWRTRGIDAVVTVSPVPGNAGGTSQHGTTVGSGGDVIRSTTAPGMTLNCAGTMCGVPAGWLGANFEFDCGGLPGKYIYEKI
jgi:hypothetical protein